MIATSVLLAVAVLAWPLPCRGELRLRALAAGGRLTTRSKPAGRSRGPLRWPRRRSLLALSGVGGVVVSLVLGVAFGLVAGAVTLATGTMGEAVARRRGEAADLRTLIAALGLVGVELEAGSSPGSALRAAGAVAGRFSDQFVKAAMLAQRGEDVRAAFAGERQLRLIAEAWRISLETGMPLATVVRQVESDLAARVAQTREVSVALAGPRASATLLAALPVVGLLLGTAMGARPWEVLSQTPAGRGLLCGGVLLDVLGLSWIAKLLDRAERAP